MVVVVSSLAFSDRKLVLTDRIDRAVATRRGLALHRFDVEVVGIGATARPPGFSINAVRSALRSLDRVVSSFVRVVS
jgi:uncharacterized protein YcbX